MKKVLLGILCSLFLVGTSYGARNSIESLGNSTDTIDGDLFGSSQEWIDELEDYKQLTDSEAFALIEDNLKNNPNVIDSFTPDNPEKANQQNSKKDFEDMIFSKDFPSAKQKTKRKLNVNLSKSVEKALKTNHLTFSAAQRMIEYDSASPNSPRMISPRGEEKKVENGFSFNPKYKKHTKVFVINEVLVKAVRKKNLEKVKKIVQTHGNELKIRTTNRYGRVVGGIKKALKIARELKLIQIVDLLKQINQSKK